MPEQPAIFRDLAQAEVGGGEHVMLAALYKAHPPVSPGPGLLGITLDAAIQAAAHKLSRGPSEVLVALTEEHVFIFEAKSTWRGWVVQRTWGLWPRAGLKVQPLEPPFSLEVVGPDGRKLSLYPHWTTEETGRIFNALAW